MGIQFVPTAERFRDEEAVRDPKVRGMLSQAVDVENFLDITLVGGSYSSVPRTLILLSTGGAGKKSEYMETSSSPRVISPSC